MPFDLSTLLALSCVVTALQSGVMLILWIRRPHATWLLWRAAVYVFGGGFLFLFLLDHVSMRQISIWLGTCAFMAATFTVWSSARVFAGKDPLWPALIAALGLWAGLSILTDTINSLLPAVVIQSIAGIAFIGGGALEHWRARRDGRTAGEWGVIWLYAAVALFFAVRLPFIGFMPFPVGALQTDLAWTTALVLGLDLAAILLTVLTLSGMRREALEGEGPEVL